MTKILVPTDFSHTAQRAFAYAQKWSESFPDARIHVVHLYVPAVESEYPNTVPPIPEFIEARQDMLQQFVADSMDACREELQHPAPVTYELEIGFPADEIAKLSAEYDLIIMGTTGATDLLDRWFGSVSSNVARRAQCPVLMVPKDASFSPIRHILYAANYESADEDAVEQLLAINRYLNATLHFLHVAEADDDPAAFAKSKAELFEGLFEEGVPQFSFTMDEVPGKDITESISHYADANGIDLVVMATRQRSFWERFFHRSQSRRMALTTRLPLMIYHFAE